MSNTESTYLVIRENESTLHRVNEPPVTYKEGKLSDSAKERYAKIRKTLEGGYLENVIQECKQPNLSIALSNEHIDLINEMVNSITSEVGRAVVGLYILAPTAAARIESDLFPRHPHFQGKSTWPALAAWNALIR